MADDQLKLDVIVDDHGGVKVLEDIDRGVAKVTNTASTSKTVLDQLGQQFGVNTVNMSAFGAETEAGILGLSGLSIAAGLAVPVAAALGVALRSAAEDARKFAEAGELLDEVPSRMQAVAAAAEAAGGSGDRMVAILVNLQEKIGSGKLDGDIRRLTGSLQGFKDQGIVDQLLDINEAINDIDDQSARAAERVRVFGSDAEEMGRRAKAGFREAVNGATTMKDDTIKELAELEKQFDGFISRVKQKSKAFTAETFMAFLHGLQNNHDDAGASENQGIGELPTPRRASNISLGSTLPTAGADPAALSQLFEMDKAAADLKKEIAGSLEASIKMAEIWGSEMPEAILFVSPAFAQLQKNQEQIAKAGGDWADVLNKRVAAAVDNINGKLVNAVMLNSQIAGNSGANRDRILKELTATANPNESAYDKRFNEIDQAYKDKVATIDQTDRVSAAKAENTALEEMNAEILKLQMNWEKTGAVVDDHKNKVTELGNAYRSALTPGGAGGGTALPGGLVMPTAEQIANHRYYGPVDANGAPDASRMGGAAPVQNNFHINAPNSVNANGWDDLVRQLETALAERETNQGARVGR